MISSRAILAVVLAVALVAGSASAQTSPTQSADERVAALEQLVESQETLIGQQQTLIDNQETLLNTYRCMFKIDVQVVPGGCAGPALSEAEAADAALLCAGWRDEALSTQQIIGDWTAIANLIESGSITVDNPDDPLLRLAAVLLPQYRDRVTAIIPSLMSERLVRSMTAVADGIQALADIVEDVDSLDEVAATIRAAVDRFNELEAVFVEICA